VEPVGITARNTTTRTFDTERAGGSEMDPTGATRRKLAAILSADAVGYSRLMGQDDRATVETLKAYRAAIARIVELRQGRVVNTPGDAVLAEFPSAVDAVQSAVEIQRELRSCNAERPPERRMAFRIGVNLGEVIQDADGTVYGDGVNVAARVEALAEAGGVSISGKVFDEVERKLDLGFEFAGDHAVKNIERPVRVYRVRPEGRVGARRAKLGVIRGLRRRWVAAGSVLALGIAGTATWQVARWSGLATDPVLVLPSGPSVAVLPFVNLSGDPRQEYFVDGLTENIITALSRFSNLFVIARNSTFQYKGQPADVRKVGQALRVRYVLEGSVRRAAATVRVSAQLIDTTKAAHLWAETYDRDLTAANIFEVQDEITERVVATIAGDAGVIPRAGVEHSKSKRTQDLESYECVLRMATYLWVLTADEHLRLRDCLERAVERDPKYPDAWAWLAYIYAHEHSLEYNPRPQLYNPLDQALEMGRRAVALDPTSQAAHRALAFTYFLRHDLDQFLVEAERTVAANPNNAATIAFMGLLMAYAGNEKRGLALITKAKALDPNYPGWYHRPFARHYFNKGDYEAALAEARRISMPGFFWAHILLAASYGQLGRTEEAQAAVADLLKAYPRFTFQTYVHEARKWNATDEEIERMLDGLRKAGLDTPPEERRKAAPATQGSRASPASTGLGGTRGR
jgi:adenylate cyclase